LIRHFDSEIDIARRRAGHTDHASADAFDPLDRGFGGKFIGPN
jgi:hypothetical protein